MAGQSGIADAVARVGNYQVHPYWSVLIDQPWVH